MKKILNLQNKKQPQVTEDPNLFLSRSPNLLNQAYSQINLIESYRDKILKWLKVPIVLIQILFIIVLALNVYFNQKISSAVQEVGVLEKTLLSKSKVYEQIRTLSTQINIYKGVVDGRISLNSAIDTIQSELPPTIQILSANYTSTDAKVQKKARLELLAPDAISVAYFISSIVSLDNVYEVQLNSASLRSRDNKFEVSLDVEFE